MEAEKQKQVQNGLSLLFLAMTLLLGIMLTAKLVTMGTNTSAQAVLHDPKPVTDPCRVVQKQISFRQKLADILKKNNLFQPPPPPPQPPTEVQAIFGNQAWINGKWYGEGDTVPPGAKLIAIEPTRVKLLWQGQTKILSPIMAHTSSSGPPSDRKKIRNKIKPINQYKSQQPAPTHTTIKTSGDKPGANDIISRLNLPESVKEKIRQRWNQLTPEQQQRMKERFQNMPAGDRMRMMRRRPRRRN